MMESRFVNWVRCNDPRIRIFDRACNIVWLFCRVKYDAPIELSTEIPGSRDFMDVVLNAYRKPVADLPQDYKPVAVLPQV